MPNGSKKKFVRDCAKSSETEKYLQEYEVLKIPGRDSALDFSRRRNSMLMPRIKYNTGNKRPYVSPQNLESSRSQRELYKST